MRERDIDGFKFDFIDMFRVTDYTGDAPTKRLGTANLRLANGTAAAIPRFRHGARTRRVSAAPQFDAKRLCASARKIKQSQNFRAAAKNHPARKFRPP